jgi:hypothetical protein
LSSDDQETFKEVVLEAFVPDLVAGRFRPSLGVKRFQSVRGVWEMRWAADGRATFSYGEEVRLGEPHVIWRRIGSHAIYRDA